MPKTIGLNSTISEVIGSELVLPHRHKVRANKESDQIEINAMQDWSGVSLNRLVDLARQTVIINWCKANRDKLPDDGATIEYNVLDAGKGGRRSFEQKFDDMTADQQNDYMARLESRRKK